MLIFSVVASTLFLGNELAILKISYTKEGLMTLKNVLFSAVILLSITGCAGVTQKDTCQVAETTKPTKDDLVIYGENANECLKMADGFGITSDFICELPDGSQIDYGATFSLNVIPEVD